MDNVVNCKVEAKGTPATQTSKIEYEGCQDMMGGPNLKRTALGVECTNGACAYFQFVNQIKLRRPPEAQ